MECLSGSADRSRKITEIIRSRRVAACLRIRALLRSGLNIARGVFGLFTRLGEPKQRGAKARAD